MTYPHAAPYHSRPNRVRSLIIPCLIAAFFLLLTDGNAEPVHRLTADEYEATLSYWEEKYDTLLEVERIGESREGMGIFLLKITDPESSAKEKQHSLITALHGGPERSGTTACMHVIEWLLSDADDAKLT
ncbi:M14 family zinc carboxypeptidase, partial [Verrucomicrobiales bacterium]|nr:M14 family zinc carboxypeptidase [Verrucomicrobiales bacterium]